MCLTEGFSMPFQLFRKVNAPQMYTCIHCSLYSLYWTAVHHVCHLTSETVSLYDSCTYHNQTFRDIYLLPAMPMPVILHINNHLCQLSNLLRHLKMHILTYLHFFALWLCHSRVFSILKIVIRHFCSSCRHFKLDHSLKICLGDFIAVQ